MASGADFPLCELAFRRDGGELTSVRLILKGDAAIFPSTSNSRQIGYHWGYSRKTSQRTRLPFICKSKFQINRLALITAAYAEAVVACGVLPPTFGAEPVTVFCLLAKARGRFDSHNYSKPVGDWLQSVGLIDDDSRAEIFCIKRDEYDGFKTAGGPATEIIVCRRSLCRNNTRAFFEAHRSIITDI